jgi:hypothetical protein
MLCYVAAFVIFHPARIAMVVFAVVALLVFAFSAAIRGGWRRVHELYHIQFAKVHRERQLVAAIAFYVTFAVVRILTHAIHNGSGPFHDISVGGRHIHHLVWGILLLMIAGYGWLLQIGTDVHCKSRWPGRLLATLYAAGAALTLDEFALWLNLRDVYWDRQGRVSIDAVILFGCLLAIGVLGGRFFRALAREAVGPLIKRQR